MSVHTLKTLVLVGVVTSLVTTVTLGVLLFGAVKRYPDAAYSLLGKLATVPTPESSSTAQPERTVVETVKAANPAVVAITISKNVPIYEQYLEQVPWGSFFGRGFSFSVPRVREKGTELREVGGGSGFIVSADGYIVTNRHVVEDEEAEYAVFLNDGTKYDARVIARDTVLDIAIMKVEAENLPYLEFGDSKSIEVGETVIAIGNALAEFRNTVSVGVVSGLSRSIVARDGFNGDAESLDELIQTDAAINQGNSGGPLIDLEGKVIGVNVAVASGAENIGFALSTNSVRTVVESVKNTGTIVRPYLGVRYTLITKELKERNNLTVEKGALVSRGATPQDLAVIPGSPADKAGIVENDIILSIDGTDIDEGHDLAMVVREKSVGDTLTLKVLSKGSEKEVKVTLDAMP